MDLKDAKHFISMNQVYKSLKKYLEMRAKTK